MSALNTFQYKQCLCILKLPKYIIYRQDFHNLQTRKKSEMVQTIQIELSINSNTTRSQI